MKYILQRLRQSSTASHIRVHNQRGQCIEVAVRHATLEMNWRVGENWRDYSNDELLTEIKLLLGMSPVSTNLIINRLANSHTELAVHAVAALIQWLPAQPTNRNSRYLQPSPTGSPRTYRR